MPIYTRDNAPTWTAALAYTYERPEGRRSGSGLLLSQFEGMRRARIIRTAFSKLCEPFRFLYSRVHRRAGDTLRLRGTLNAHTVRRP